MGLAKNGHCLHTRITGVIWPCSYSVLNGQMVSHQWMDYGNLWISLITVTTSTISLNTPRLYIILNYQQNKSCFWTNTISYHSDEMIYQFIHTNKQEDTDAQMCTCYMNYIHLCMGTHEYTHTTHPLTFQQDVVLHFFLRVLVEGLGLLANCSTGWQRTEKCRF